ncbi:phosphatase PAP2 family protein [Stenotrophomonas sp. CPCC 101365]|uniref:Phosphatase PAP2 family protein n=2 Tax=Stenotrophomonas mori TaxID=2871096 RepID=A0ABT0SGC3_9GAMM|nr:phosphatase PAP2 family protein [Stenotrophomonas mori]MCL7714374.1 phosphatase PAP2 family protein [Stenotrophomonas mori]
MAGNGDQWLADLLYRGQGGRWALKDAWWTSQLIHRGGKNLSVLASLLVLLALLRACLDPRWRALRAPLLYLLLAVGLATGGVALLKPLTGLDCPWDLQRYGGGRPFVGLFQPRPATLGAAACFPAGHASAGYAWVALYFFALQARPRWRGRALGVALATGLVFGIAQQLRGAHFLSHDVATLALCWSTAVLLYLPLVVPAPAVAPTMEEPA